MSTPSNVANSDWSGSPDTEYRTLSPEMLQLYWKVFVENPVLHTSSAVPFSSNVIVIQVVQLLLRRIYTPAISDAEYVIPVELSVAVALSVADVHESADVLDEDKRK